ncbi:DUF3107 family protein [Nocardioides perillae]|uniref:DUF3107 domain-containing protein n=1 Tax=Nocardioides perillae TaxID=1119534 RepID=A0A7Y9RTX7_9ACTN|nr:hypothetical protein [Nocardioides perillae]
MEVKIGVQHAARELTVETDQTQEEVEALVHQAVADGSVLALTDSKKRRIVVPGAKIAYVEIGGGTVGQVGFRS